MISILLLLPSTIFLFRVCYLQQLTQHFDYHPTAFYKPSAGMFPLSLYFPASSLSTSSHIIFHLPLTWSPRLTSVKTLLLQDWLIQVPLFSLLVPTHKIKFKPRKWPTNEPMVLPSLTHLSLQKDTPSSKFTAAKFARRFTSAALRAPSLKQGKEPPTKSSLRL